MFTPTRGLVDQRSGGSEIKAGAATRAVLVVCSLGEDVMVIASLPKPVVVPRPRPCLDAALAN